MMVDMEKSQRRFLEDEEVLPNSTNFDRMKSVVQQLSSGLEKGFSKHTLWMNPPWSSSWISPEGVNWTNAMMLNTAKHVFQAISAGLSFIGLLPSIHFFARKTRVR